MLRAPAERSDVFDQKTVLIVEENFYLALDLSVSIEEMDGTVAGPARSVPEAIALLEREPVSAAIVDCHVGEGDIGLLAMQLALRRVPFVIHTHSEVPEPLVTDHPHVPVLRKPLHPRTVLSCLLLEMRRLARGGPRPNR